MLGRKGDHDALWGGCRATGALDLSKCTAISLLHESTSLCMLIARTYPWAWSSWSIIVHMPNAPGKGVPEL